MSRTPTGRCLGCSKPMWTKPNLPNPKYCHPCRSDGSKRSARRPGRSVSLEEQRRRMTEARLAPAEITCRVCTSTFQGIKGRKYCDPCRTERQADRMRAKAAKRRAASGSSWRSTDIVTGEVITISALGERDRWTCWLCNEFVNRELSGRDPWMPSFDHVTPISKGGLDSWDNLRLAHLRCNVQRGAKLSHVL